MWIFGYGSLMWDGWQAAFSCLRYVPAELPGYQRIFNKASVVNWGNKSDPSPTLNLMQSDARCRGVAFEFFDEAWSEIEPYLRKREGKDFELRELNVVLDGGETVGAIVPIYRGKNLVRADKPSAMAALVNRASGRNGSCRAYVLDVAAKLEAMGVNDPAVVALVRALSR